ncbi:class IIb bacteriocin, lactobin A/cerein 7B family [Daejeonella sp.]|uniref:class IIb bacteriocin, lactobin A/cerein 7B family n=1 Tax=Daejeonella sp. TaxID=2805397 RepID=UPI0025BFF2D4|nr:class IIb bacteriocin, lactobin A/cerein 7B family [Daejeonella sp.]
MKLENLNLVELDAREMNEVEGGFIPLIIFGYYLSAKVVAAGCFGAMALGTAAGIAVFSKQ